MKTDSFDLVSTTILQFHFVLTVSLTQIQVVKTEISSLPQSILSEGFYLQVAFDMSFREERWVNKEVDKE